jgi:hypothetical protein
MKRFEFGLFVALLTEATTPTQKMEITPQDQAAFGHGIPHIYKIVQFLVVLRKWHV